MDLSPNALITYQETPVQDISHHPLARNAGVRVVVKREDLNHPGISGNKWWKLKYNIDQAINDGHHTLLTFGGAYSNHIHATAAAANAMGLNAIGVIRGEETLPLNPTLRFAADNRMKLDYVDRHTYRKKESLTFLQQLREKWGDFYLIPEGGTNELAVRGTEEFGRLINRIPADYICLPVGTGGTMAGMVRGLSSSKTVVGFSVLKNGSFLRPIIEELAGTAQNIHWELMTEFAYGGYGKRSTVVTEFIKGFFEYTNIPLDFVYTGKMMCAVFELISKGYFRKGKTILAIHTGGLQGHSPFPCRPAPRI